jgi:hypothetical protein
MIVGTGRSKVCAQISRLMSWESVGATLLGLKPVDQANRLEGQAGFLCYGLRAKFFRWEASVSSFKVFFDCLDEAHLYDGR